MRNAYSRLERVTRAANQRYSDFLGRMSDDVFLAYVREHIYENMSVAEFAAYQRRKGETEEQIALDIDFLYRNIDPSDRKEPAR